VDTFGSVLELLDYAIGKEQEAHQFYMSLTTRTDNSSLKKLFEDFAKEELGHKAKLEAVKEGKKLLSAEKRVADLKIADYTPEVDFDETEEFDFQKALLVAMHREKAAFKLYSNLAGITDDAELKELLQGLANEEAKHKLYFETQYDERVLKEN